MSRGDRHHRLPCLGPGQRRPDRREPTGHGWSHGRRRARRPRLTDRSALVTHLAASGRYRISFQGNVWIPAVVHRNLGELFQFSRPQIMPVAGSAPSVHPGDRPVAAQLASLQAEGAGTADRRRRPPDCGRRGIRASSIQRMIVTSETPRRKPIDFNDAPAWYHRSIRVMRERCTSISVSIRAFLTVAILAALAALRSRATVASL
jgi:hypothetical protein